MTDTCIVHLSPLQVREKEAEDYAVELKELNAPVQVGDVLSDSRAEIEEVFSQDYKESVDAIGKALDTMEKQVGWRCMNNPELERVEGLWVAVILDHFNRLPGKAGSRPQAGHWAAPKRPSG